VSLPKVEAIPLRSAMNIILKQVGLTWIIDDDVLKVTTEQGAKGKRVQKVYSVADLVIPIDNYALPNSSKLTTVLEQQSQRSLRSPFGNGNVPTSPTGGLNSGSQVSSMSTIPGAGLPGAAANQMSTVGGLGASTTTFAKTTIEDVLMKLITNVVQPSSWSDVGGSGTIDYFPIGMALVINQTPDIQEQVAELLDSLRRLQDMEVAVEVRIINVEETFFERIGMDFSLNLPGQKTVTLQNQLTTGVFQPAGLLNTLDVRGPIVGLTPAGNFTKDLDIPIAATSFNRAIPPFGYPNSPGNNGGLSLGLAFLNDIQVFMFMEAAQGDRRTNVMTAPKLTLFNGQTSTIFVSDFQFFVTDVNVFSINGQLVFQPINTAFPIGPSNDPAATGVSGISLAIQAVVSADRRFVRLNLNPIMESLASATVPLFPVTVIVTPTFEGGFVGQPLPFTQFIQQPKLSVVDIRTTVQVPDGGTVLLGGLKSLSEGRNEAGPPVLSKIPYINRLVKNTGYGREATSMMIMVTPRIIINAEEEERQTGYQGPTGQ
jgi:type II secretory pathway component GspD/PulD (secretin)